MNKEDYDVDLKSIWERIGHIMHICHMIEYNLCYIAIIYKLILELQSNNNLTLEEFNSRNRSINNEFCELCDKSTIGSLVEINRKIKSIDNDFLDEIFDDTRDGRNYFSHDFFKAYLINETLNKIPDNLITLLDDEILKFENVNNRLVDILINYKKQLSLIKDSLTSN